MSPDEMIEALEAHGSLNDPVTYRDEETDAATVLSLLGAVDARRVRIRYYAARGEVDGTFGGMLRDRRRTLRRVTRHIRGRKNKKKALDKLGQMTDIYC